MTNEMPLRDPARPLIEDLPPRVVQDRSVQGIVELVLDEGTTVKAVGVVFGLEHVIQGPGYRATLFLDHYNRRIKILDYTAEDLEALILKVRYLSEANGFDKIFCMAHPEDWVGFLRHGYVLEAVLKHYLQGQDAFIVSKFRSQERLSSKHLMEEILMVEQVMATPLPTAGRSPLPDGIELRMARREDIPELINLYQTIFASYPSPLTHVSYLETVFETESIFAVCTREGRIISAASAELHPAVLAVELTDCATMPEARGLGLMSHILARLEDEVRQRGYICAYTMARARSYGMNTVFHRLGYAFNGRLVNNCDIFGDMEDMNIWVKNLRPSR